MKKIGIDARLIDETGVGTYINNLILNLSNKEVVYYIYLLKEEQQERLQNLKINCKFIIAPFKWHSFSEQLDFLKLLNTENLDLMHFTYFSYPLFYNKKFIITIHDLTPYLFKTGKASTKNKFIYEIKHFFYKILLKNAVKKSSNIITPTKTVKKQIIKIFGENYENKIYPIPEGINLNLINATENNSLTKTYKNFFLYVGNFYPHKNIEKLIMTFKKIENEKLVLVGKKDYFFNKIFNLVKKNNLENKIEFFTNARTEDLKFFYKNAKALIFPSLSEGFGLPIIEASYFNTPIIASNIEVFKEILGENYYSFDPNKIDSIINAISSFLERKKTFNKIDINNFSFSTMSKDTENIYFKNI